MYCDVELRNGKILLGNKIGELVHEIINKFSEEKLTYDEAIIVMKEVEKNIGGYSKVQSTS